MPTFFVTGISTDVGKTIASAIITELLEADYWKPIQAGDLENSDTDKIRRLISNKKTKLYSNSFSLNTPASPHFAAQIDGVSITSDKIIRPKTKNILVIEGAGGLLVPINKTQTIAEIIQPEDYVIVVSRHYLGSINHTLLTIEALKNRNLNVAGIIFSGNEIPSSEEIILSKTGIECIGRIEEEPYFDKNVIREYADKFRSKLTTISIKRK